MEVEVKITFTGVPAHLTPDQIIQSIKAHLLPGKAHWSPTIDIINKETHAERTSHNSPGH